MSSDNDGQGCLLVIVVILLWAIATHIGAC
jgi:hypothetical protein